MIRTLTILFAVTLFVSCSDKNLKEHRHVKPMMKTGYQGNSRMDTIDTGKFWMMMDDAVKVSNGNQAVKAKYLEAQLTKLSPLEIRYFEIAFRKEVIEADDFKVMAAQKIIEGTVTDDSYLYFRCWLIGQGKTVYTETLKNPDYLATIAKKGDICEFEELMYVATDAYSKKTGKHEDETFPREVAYTMGLDYDLGAPVTKGTDWTNDQLPKLYPTLWAVFN